MVNIAESLRSAASSDRTCSASILLIASIVPILIIVRSKLRPRRSVLSCAWLWFLVSVQCFPIGNCPELTRVVSLTDRASNSLVVSLLETEDLAQKICVLEALSLRADNSIEDILLFLTEPNHRSNKSSSAECELLLRVCVSAVFPLDLAAEPMQRRIDMNSGALQTIVSRLPGFRDRLLRDHVLHLLAYMPEEHAIPALVDVGNKIICMLDDQNGRVAHDQKQEIRSFIKASRLLQNEVSKEQLITIAGLVRDRSTVELARDAARD